jgi:hypothetical protein
LLAFRFARLAALLLALATGAAPAQDRPSVPQYQRLDFFYLATDDCPYCRRWEARTKDEFLASPEGRVLNFVHVKGRMLREPIAAQHYPPGYLWAYDQIGPSRGVPRFVLAMDGKVVLSSFGLHEFESSFRPAVKALVEGQKPRR